MIANDGMGIRWIDTLFLVWFQIHGDHESPQATDGQKSDAVRRGGHLGCRRYSILADALLFHHLHPVLFQWRGQSHLLQRMAWQTRWRPQLPRIPVRTLINYLLFRSVHIRVWRHYSWMIMWVGKIVDGKVLVNIGKIFERIRVQSRTNSFNARVKWPAFRLTAATTSLP